MRILIDGAEAVSSAIEPGENEVTALVSRAKGESFQVEVLFEAQQKWSPAADDRDLALMLIEMRVEHFRQRSRRKREGRLFRW